MPGCKSLKWTFAASTAVVLATLAAIPAGGAAGAGGLELRIDLPARSFIRGGLDPVEGLVATLTVTNNAITASSLPEPRLDPVGVAEFEVYLNGAPYGVAKTDQTPARTRIRRNVPLLAVGADMVPLPGYTVKPGDSKEFKLNVGRNYAIKAAGRYEMTCLYEGQRSNTVQFEVLPIKRVDVIPPVFLMRLEDYEVGEPDFPFMFYIAEGQGRFDEIVFLVRAGSGATEHYEFHGLAKVTPGVTPQVVVAPGGEGEFKIAGAKVGLMVPDRANENNSRLFAIDFSTLPMKVKAREFIHEPGSPPVMSVDASGEITAE